MRVALLFWLRLAACALAPLPPVFAAAAARAEDLSREEVSALLAGAAREGRPADLAGRMLRGLYQPP